MRLKPSLLDLRPTHTYRWPAKRGLLEELSDVLRNRDLLLLLVQKDLKVKYKGTALGFVWSLLNPLLMMIVYAAVFSVLVRFQVPNYPIFLLSGLLPWNAFNLSLQAASTSLITNGNLVRRVHFPLEFLPLTSVISGLVNLVMSFGILVVFTLVFRQPLGLPLLMLPVLVLLQLVFTSGVCLCLSALLVYFRDIEYLIGVGLTAFFFLTPVIYPLSAVSNSQVGFLLRFNPMTWLVTGYQAIWHDNAWPNPTFLGVLAVGSIAMLLFGRWVFRRLQGRFAEEV
jgi:lipopolysaccharide transport system permease protein